MTKRKATLAAITTIAVLFGLVSATQAQVRVGPNYNLRSDPSAFRARDQIGLGVSRTNPDHVVGINADYFDLECEASMSTDGGDTWSTAVPLLPPDPGIGEAPWDKRCSFHQSVEFGSGQNVYAIVTARRTAPALPDDAVLVYRSTDGGATWERGRVAMPSGPGTNDSSSPSPGPSYSRPSVAVDPGAGPGGQDIVYAVGRDTRGTDNSGTGPGQCTSACGSVKVATSTNGGQSFGAPVNVSPRGVNAQDAPPSVVNSNGSITVGWRTIGRDGLLQVSRSPRGGQSWSTPIDVAVVRNRARFAVNDSHLPPPPQGPNSTTSTNPRMASDPTRPGWIYIVYGDPASGGPIAPPGGFRGADHFINYDSQVYFQRSRDNGETWSEPKRVSDPTPYPGSLTIQTRQPNVSVSPSGRVSVVWQDRRHWYQSGMPAGGDASMERNCTHSHIFCYDIRLGDTYLSSSTDGGDTFSRNIRVSDRSHNNDVGYDTRPGSGYWSWGPQAVTVGGGRLLVGWMDSREGNWDTDTEDFYLAKVDFDATGPVPETNIDEPDAISRSVALSRLGYLAGNEGALAGGSRDPANAGLTGGTPGGPASRNASRIVVVNEDDVAGAMAGTVLARAYPAPVLLSPAGSLPDSVAAEIRRIRPESAFVIGDTGRLSNQVRDQVAAAAGIAAARVARLSGATDAATAAMIPSQFDYRVPAEMTADVPAFDAAVVANPASPDTAAVVGLAAARRLPILYVNADSIPQQTRDALTSLDVERVLVVGGTDDVSSGVVQQLQALPKLGGANAVRRLGGANQYETSREVVTESRNRGLPTNVVYAADGANPMDATLLGGVVARATGTLMLAEAPLYSTAAGQASAFGLTGIDRFILVGPPAPPPPPGDTPPPPAPPAPPPGGPAAMRPTLSRVTVSPRTFRAAQGTTIRFTVSDAARVSIAIGQRTMGRRVSTRCLANRPALRRRPRCVRTLTRGTLRRNASQGTNRLRFTGRVNGRLLRPGNYQFTLRATNAAGSSRPVVVTFRIRR